MDDYGSIPHADAPSHKPLMPADTPPSHVELPAGHTEHTHDEVDGTFKAAVFGFSDGLCTNVNLVLGMYMALAKTGSHAHDAAQVNHLVIMTGLAGLFAGASSMACGEWLSAKAEKGALDRELARERWHHESMPEVEAAHMHEVLVKAGLSAEVASLVNRDLAKLPLSRQVDFHAKFELGIDVDDSESPLKNALYMWFCFAVGALLPVFPWWLTHNHRFAFIGTVIATVVGVALTSLYQVGGRFRELPLALVRQIFVTAIAVGATIGLNLGFARFA